MTLPELALLQRFAHEAGTVLEIGTYLGFTCIGMALAGAHVTSVDPHNEGPGGSSTWEPFLRNIERHGFLPVTIAPFIFGWYQEQGTITVYHMPVEMRFSTPDTKWAGIFIDGDHVAPAPWRDAEIAMAHLAPGGWIAFHDVAPRWPDVWQAALQLNAKGWREVGREGSLRVYQK